MSLGDHASLGKVPLGLNEQGSAIGLNYGTGLVRLNLLKNEENNKNGNKE